MPPILDAARIDVLLDQLAAKLAAELTPETETVLVGIRSRGVPLAHRLAARLTRLHRQDIPVGSLDITLYRDDLHQRRRWPVVTGSEIPISIDDRRVILVDDVLFTGRTAVAALTALSDLGRPALVRLVTLVDRGHRECPIQADYIGMTLETAPGDRVNVRLSEVDGKDEVVVL
ncbi:MAG: bifunctional pyr operon transcriptional regulator/uracil phosphoribosyltransferase PyrR [Gemmatales bacterium]